MSGRADIVARIGAILARRTGADADAFVADKSLLGQDAIDCLDLVEIAATVEEEFGLYDIGSNEWPWSAWTIDKIADAVMAAKNPST